jgi:hypothetical protein
MSQMFRGSFFELHYPGHWEEMIVEDIPTFFDPEGGGVLQIASTRKQDGLFDITWEFERYLNKQNIELDPAGIISYKNEQDIDCQVCEYTQDNRFWLVSVMAHMSHLIFVIYNSDIVPDPETAKLISEVMQSIRFLTVEKSE